MKKLAEKANESPNRKKNLEHIILNRKLSEYSLGYP